MSPVNHPYAPVAQLAEADSLKGFQSGFESQWGHLGRSCWLDGRKAFRKQDKEWEFKKSTGLLPQVVITRLPFIFD